MLFVCDECLEEVNEIPCDGYNGGMICSTCDGHSYWDDDDYDYDDEDED